MAHRITRAMAETLAVRLNETLNLPIDCYVKNDQGQYVAQIGCIHLLNVYGGYNVCQLVNSAGGVRTLAVGLTAREVYEWLAAALEGVRLARMA